MTPFTDGHEDEDRPRSFERIERVPVRPALSYRDLLTIALIMQPGKDFGLYGPWQCPQVIHDLNDAEFAYFNRLNKLLAASLGAISTDQLAALVAERVLTSVDPMHERFLQYSRPTSR